MPSGAFLIQAMSSPTVCDLPAVEALGRHQHGEVGLAAGAWEGGAEIGLFATWRLDAHDEHMLGHPAFVARHHRGDAQSQALLAEKRIAAVTRAVGPDFVGFREVHDIFAGDVGLAGPRHVLLPGRQRRADRVHAGDERAVAAQRVEDGGAHARHDAHVGHDIGAICNLDADLGDWRADWPHAERDHVHCPPGHAAVEQPVERLPHLRRRGPIVGGTGIVFVDGADEGAILDAANVGRMRAGEVAVRTLLRVEPDERSRIDHHLAKPVVFLLRSVHPHDLIRLAQRRHLVNPGA